MTAASFPVHFAFEDNYRPDGTPVQVLEVSLPPGTLRFPLDQSAVSAFAAMAVEASERNGKRLFMPTGIPNGATG